jgi:nucleoside-diphosphate-sugar epimerase
MMYMPDTIRAILELMEADGKALTVRTSYNITGASFSAGELADEIQRHLPSFECRFAPDFRQEIADSWPASIDDAQARADWGWQAAYDMPAIVVDMLENLRAAIDNKELAGSSLPSR